MLTQLVPDVYVLESAFVQSKRGLILDATGSTMIDTSVAFNETRLMIQQAEEAGAPLRRLLLTHSHFDHSAGSQLLHYIERIAQRRAGEWMLSNHAANYLAQRPAEHPNLEAITITLPTLEINGTAEIRLSDRSLSLLPTPGHSPDSMSILLQPEGILFAGDAVVTCFPPIIQDGSGFAEIESLRRILKLDFRWLVPGHGPVLERDPALRHIRACLDYLLAVAECVTTQHDPQTPFQTVLASVENTITLLPEGLEAVELWHERAVARLWQEQHKQAPAKA
jgi:cyclase